MMDHGLAKTVLALLSSKKISLLLFFSLALLLIPETLSSVPLLSVTKQIKPILLALLWLNLAACTISRIRKLRTTSLLIHGGCLLTITGSLYGNMGYLATVNIHMGRSTETAYRWDIESDAPLGFELRIDRINRQYYPIELKVGLLDNGKKAGLFQLKTGESFSYKEYRVEIASVNLNKQSLSLNIYRNNELMGHYDTATGADKKDFPLEFKLVAFHNPVLKRIWTDITISKEGEQVKGIAEVNNPFRWQGISFFNTENGFDPDGFPYAGIQIVRDPGIPLVYLGFATILAGCLLLLPTIFRARLPQK